MADALEPADDPGEVAVGGPAVDDEPGEVTADDPGEAARGGQVVDYEPPWREARRRVAAAWARGGTASRAVVVLGGALAAALLAAFLLHVVVGGFVKGNWTAGGFGIALASVAGVLLWIEAAVARRVLPRA